MVPQVLVSLAIIAFTRGRLGAPAAPLAQARPGRLIAVLVGALGLVVALGGFGAFAQAVAAHQDRQAFPPPGRLVDVGGHRLHLQVMGEQHTGPTVVLEAGLDSFSTNWHWVQSDLASSVRVVAYDRAGLGWSEPGPPPRDARQSATELHVALQRAGIGGPYLLAGHSYGGLVARVFARSVPGRDRRPRPGGRLAPGPVGAYPGLAGWPGHRAFESDPLAPVVAESIRELVTAAGY
jgi:pimeloyl-ACP methyl ester carboxylesterase